MAPPAGKQISIHLVKWWKPYTRESGLLTRTLSPFRMDHIRPLFSHMPESAKKRVSENVLTVAPAFVLLYGIVAWSDSTFDKELKKHRY